MNAVHRGMMKGAPDKRLLFIFFFLDLLWGRGARLGLRGSGLRLGLLRRHPRVLPGLGLPLEASTAFRLGLHAR